MKPSVAFAAGLFTGSLIVAGVWMLESIAVELQDRHTMLEPTHDLACPEECFDRPRFEITSEIISGTGPDDSNLWCYTGPRGPRDTVWCCEHEVTTTCSERSPADLEP